MYVMTDHFYPLKKNEKTTFFGGLAFDNPRNKDEIEEIAKILKEANYIGKRPFPEENYQVGDGFITLRSILEKFIENHIDENRKKLIMFTKNIYKDLAKIWVIIRFDESIIRSSEVYRPVSKNIEDKDVLQLDGSFFQSREFVLNRIAFLDFMINDSILSSIIFHDADELTKNTQIRIYPELIVRSQNNDDKETKSPSRFLPFLKVHDSYRNIIQSIGERYKSEKFNFICDSLSSMRKIYFLNSELYNLQMVSIIEFLLTHKPDYNRFNVEDSITKQFVGKLNLVLYDHLENHDSDNIEKELKYAYALRSDIAHGDFFDKDKQIMKLAKLYGTKTPESSTFSDLAYEVMIKLNDNLESYIKILLNQYLLDENRLELIKKA